MAVMPGTKFGRRHKAPFDSGRCIFSLWKNQKLHLQGEALLSGMQNIAFDSFKKAWKLFRFLTQGAGVMRKAFLNVGFRLQSKLHQLLDPRLRRRTFH
ncbi:hypothetical protein ABH904_001679 [Pseudomonas frederiksbergensis]